MEYIIIGMSLDTLNGKIEKIANNPIQRLYYIIHVCKIQIWKVSNATQNPYFTSISKEGH